MSSISVKNISIKGMAGCVPARVEENKDYPGITPEEIQKLCWLYGNASLIEASSLDGYFVGPRREMITPWSTNAVEITQNMALTGIKRIEEYWAVENEDADYDPMLQRL